MLKNVLSTACAPRDLSGPLGTFFDRCSGQEGGDWLSAFNKFLRKENPWEGAKRDFKIWKTIEIGDQKIHITVVQLFDLGFRDIVHNLDEIYRAATLAGLLLCPDGSGNILHQIYTERDGWKSINVATQPIKRVEKRGANKEETRTVIQSLGLSSLHKQLLTDEPTDSFWHSDERFAFAMT